MSSFRSSQIWNVSQLSLNSSAFNPEVVMNAFGNVKENIDQSCEKLFEQCCHKSQTANSKPPAVKLEEEAKKVLGDVTLRLISLLCSPVIPVTISEVNSRLNPGTPVINSRLMPNQKQLDEFRLNAERGKKKQMLLPVDKMYNAFKAIDTRFDLTVAFYISAIVEHLLTQFIQASINYEGRITNQSATIRCSTIRTLFNFYVELESSDASGSTFVQRFPNDYDQCVKELQSYLTVCLEHMALIIRVFREPVNLIFPGTGDLQNIFGCIMDVHNDISILVEEMDDMFESRSRFVGSCFADLAEGDAFQNFSQYGEAVLSATCRNRLSRLLENHQLLQGLTTFSRQIIRTIREKASSRRQAEMEARFTKVHPCDVCSDCLSTTDPSVITPTVIGLGVGLGHSPPTTNGLIQQQPPSLVCNYLINAFRYLLPRLLLLPVFHFLHLAEIVKKLNAKSSQEMDQLVLSEVLCVLTNTYHPLRRAVIQNEWAHAQLPRLMTYFRTPISSPHLLREAKTKLDDIERNIKKTQETWERPTGHFEFIMEGVLQVRTDPRKLSDRYGYLFTSWLLLCKKQQRRVIGPGTATGLKVKKKVTLTQIHMTDYLNAEEFESGSCCLFGLEYLETTTQAAQQIVFAVKTAEEKADWMGALMQIQTQRLLSRYLRELPKEEVSFKLPPVELYRFAEPDTRYNIVFEGAGTPENSAEIPVIKAATLVKLVERITYPAYYDWKTLSSFLQVFRNFTTSHELLDLLIERFNIPEPSFDQYASPSVLVTSGISGSGPDIVRPGTVGVGDDSPESVARRKQKRFRTAYKKRVQLRVLSVLTKWTKEHAYYRLDFAKDEDLRSQLEEFLDTVDARHLHPNVETIKKYLRGEWGRMVQTFDKEPPKIIDFGLIRHPKGVRLTNVHPLEFARQITLFEWELYRSIEFWEVNGKEKTTSPNLQRSLEFSNKLKCWFVYSIMSRDNMDDRITIMLRIADIMQICEQLNNLQGAQEAKGALISAPVYRLYDTYDALMTRSRPHYRSLFESLYANVDDANETYMADYHRKIHNISPPGLPFIGFGSKTQLIHLEIKNPDYIPVHNPGTGDDVQLVNFWKFRQISEVVDHYLSFQRTAYNLAKDDNIRRFLEELDPFSLAGVADENAFDDTMHERSLTLQPKEGEPAFSLDRDLDTTEIRLAQQLSEQAGLPVADLADLTRWMLLLPAGTGSMAELGRSPQSRGIAGNGSAPLPHSPAPDPGPHPTAHPPPLPPKRAQTVRNTNGRRSREDFVNAGPDCHDGLRMSPLVGSPAGGMLVSTSPRSGSYPTGTGCGHQHSMSDSLLLEGDSMLMSRGSIAGTTSSPMSGRSTLCDSLALMETCSTAHWMPDDNISVSSAISVSAASTVVGRGAAVPPPRPPRQRGPSDLTDSTSGSPPSPSVWWVGGSSAPPLLPPAPPPRLSRSVSAGTSPPDPPPLPPRRIAQAQPPATLPILPPKGQRR